MKEGQKTNDKKEKDAFSPVPAHASCDDFVKTLVARNFQL